MSKAADSPSPRIFYRACLRPHRSLSHRGFRLVMAGVIAFSLVVSTGLYLAGAWPVFGFLGLDILLVYVALRASYRSGRISETLELTEGELVVERRGLKGEAGRWSFQPTWLRVELAEPVMPDTPLMLRSHGRSFVIAAFLGPEERRAVARDLSDALDEWRTGERLSA